MRPSRVFPDSASRARDGDWEALDHRAVSRRCRAQHERETRQILQGTVHGAREVRSSLRARPAPESQAALLARQARFETSVAKAANYRYQVRGLESRTPSRKSISRYSRPSRSRKYARDWRRRSWRRCAPSGTRLRRHSGKTCLSPRWCPPTKKRRHRQETGHASSRARRRRIPRRPRLASR